MPHDLVYEDDDAIAFLALWPPLWGLTLVCPTAHPEQVTGDFTEERTSRCSPSSDVARRSSLAAGRRPSPPPVASAKSGLPAR